MPENYLRPENYARHFHEQNRFDNTFVVLSLFRPTNDIWSSDVIRPETAKDSDIRGSLTNWVRSYTLLSQQRTQCALPVHPSSRNQKLISQHDFCSQIVSSFVPVMNTWIVPYLPSHIARHSPNDEMPSRHVTSH